MVERVQKHMILNNHMCFWLLPMLKRKHAACNFTYIDLHIGTERQVCLMRDIEIYLLSHHLFVSY